MIKHVPALTHLLPKPNQLMNKYKTLCRKCMGTTSNVCELLRIENVKTRKRYWCYCAVVNISYAHMPTTFPGRHPVSSFALGDAVSAYRQTEATVLR